MPWNAGVYTRTNGQFTGSTIWETDKANNIKIESARHDTHDQDLANGITACLNINGQNAMQTDLNAGSNKVVNVANGTNNLDAVNLSQLNTKLSANNAISGLSWNGTTLSALRTAGDYTTDIKLINYGKFSGLIRHKSYVFATAPAVTMDLATGSRFTLTCNSNMNLTFDKPTGADPDLQTENYAIEGSILITNGITPGTITIVGAAAGDIIGAQNLTPNAKYVLSYLIHRAAGDVYNQIYSWAT